ncbi:2OG-Fe(II) oxygenase [Burkholderia contaminans]|uniref:2OG-Fe(II) oxygenase n=1 Tax=Burkholderia contaminans TaxID=488447 RepID=UPI001CF4E32E|nr:2OG-Fe(II) oxygenase [Burkholderia contaminans]MCA7919000.1 2OG-Fe(II) oxygenase [Burkholderia contaminans]UUX38346.1 2OG-Fe(II) oxygenase [Burkholderia contaminans]
MSDPELSTGRDEIFAVEYDFEIESRGAGQIEFSLLKSHALWKSVYCSRVVNLLSDAFGVKVRLNKDNLLQLRRMNCDTPEFPLHNDYSANEDTIASFIYISAGWHPGCGGRLFLFENNDISAQSVPIEPIQNRFIAFETKNCHWHSVERVHNWERYSILALWDIDR